jgi:hypothetical protein
MPAPVYATQSDYDAWIDDPGSTTIATVVFRTASSIIDEALIGAVYATDPTTELPTDARVAEVLRDAVCAQVQWMDAEGDTTGLGGAEVDSASIGSVSFSGQRSTQPPMRLPSGRQLSAAASAVLRVEGMLPAGVIVHG